MAEPSQTHRSPADLHAPAGRSGRTLSAADRAQLAESPVPLRRIAGLFRGHRTRVVTVLALIITSSVVSMASPFLLRRVLDEAIPDQDVRLLVLLVAGMLAVAVTTALIGVTQTWIATTTGQHIMHDLRTRLFAHLQRQSMSFFTHTRGGEVQARLTQDIAAMQSVITSTATSIAANVTTVVGTVIAMTALSWRLSLLSLLVLPPAIWLTRRVARLRREITTRRQRTLANLQTQIEEGLSVSGVLLSKTLGSGPVLSERFATTSDDLVGLEVRSQLAGRWRMATMSIVFAAIPALIYLAAGLPVTAGTMTVGTLVAFTGLQSALFRPLTALLDVGVSVITSMALFSRVFEYLDLPVEIDDPPRPVALDPVSVRGRVSFEGVGFRHAGGDRNVLTDITLEVPAGGSLALVGETGAGKTTLAGLVSRLQDPTAGRVLLDGIDLRDLPLATITACVGVVSQETYLLHTSVRENLRHARPGASDQQIEEAARAAHIHGLITALPEGYDTVVGARGYRFSGGEKQRLAIARTLLRDPRVLVLDEATSALDNQTEYAVQEALDAASEGRTTITIAHRITTITDADQIAVLRQGEVVELGDHETLLGVDGQYASLVQAKEPASAAA